MILEILTEQNAISFFAWAMLSMAGVISTILGAIFWWMVTGFKSRIDNIQESLNMFTQETTEMKKDIAVIKREIEKIEHIAERVEAHGVDIAVLKSKAKS